MIGIGRRIQQLGAGRMQEAINSHFTALKLRPDMAEAYNDLGRAMMAVLEVLDRWRHGRRRRGLQQGHGFTEPDFTSSGGRESVQPFG
jgi:hypothetical protein